MSNIKLKGYIKKMRKRDAELNSNWGTFCPPLEMMAPKLDEKSQYHRFSGYMGTITQ